MGWEDFEGERVRREEKEVWGDLTDDASTEAEGKVDKDEGNVKDEWGETKDDVRDAIDDDDR